MRRRPGRRSSHSRSRRASSLRASTMSDTVLITRSSSSTDRRMVRGAAAALPLCLRRLQRDRSGGSSAPGASASISALSSPAGISSPASIAAIISPMRSMIAETALTRAASAARRPARTSASASSAAWLSASSRGNSKKPQLPFTVWTKRKMLSSRARSSGCASQATISPPKRFEHLAAFGYEIGNQVVHRRNAPSAAMRGGLCRRGVNAALSLSRRCRGESRQASRRSSAPRWTDPTAGSSRPLRPPGCAPARRRPRGLDCRPTAALAIVSRSAGSSRIRGPSARITSSTCAVARSRRRHRAARRGPARRRQAAPG